MTTGRRLVHADVAVGALGVLLVLAACSATGPDAGGPGTEGTSRTTPIPEDPTLTAKPPGSTVRVTGVVERSPEDRCLTLAATGRTWVLTGTVAGLEAGDRVTVRGRPDPDATTTCQQGPVLVVVEVERG